MPDEVTYRYHAVFTSNPHPMLEAEAEHRDHAVFEQIFADSIDGPLAHLPSVISSLQLSVHNVHDLG